MPLWCASTAMPLDQTIGYSFIALFVILDPVGTAALFVGLTRGLTEPASRRVAVRGVVIAGLLLLFFAFAGNALLAALDIGLPAFRIAGGVLLFLLAIDMVFARESGWRSLTAKESAEAADPNHDISVFPLAIPLIAGPGGLTTMVLLMGRAGADPLARAAVILVLVLVLAIALALLLTATRVVRLLGTTGVNVISRVLGVLLAAVAAQLILDGVVEGLALRQD
jgi:multiple antibiotic resistance protein